MMDLSDGLAEDLPRLCARSSVGARIYEAQIPVAASCASIADKVKLESIHMAITGGEDYELLLTCPPAAVARLQEAVQQAGSTLAVIGECTETPEVVVIDAVGHARPLGRGFDHFADGTKQHAY
jgi:thiamine-monophosphate kinase